MDRKQHKIILALGTILLTGLCAGLTFVTVGSGFTLWLALDQAVDLSTPTPRIIRRVTAISVSTPIVSVMSTYTSTLPVATPAATSTLTPLPTATPSPTHIPLTSTPTPLPPAATPTPTQAPPTVSPTPTAIPTPSFPFTILEKERFSTSHLDFDVFVAITDADNTPLAGYRIVGYHSSGLKVESQISAKDWTANSGAMHYKAGNIKYSVPKSPDGLWTLQLVNEDGDRVAPSVEFHFDTSSPSWYFILYAQVGQ